MTIDHTPRPKLSGRTKLWIGGLILIFVVAYTSVVSMYLREGHPVLTLKDVPQDAIKIDAEFLSVDLARNVMKMTIRPNLADGRYASKGKLTEDIEVEIDTGSSAFKETFHKGGYPLPWNVEVPIEFGDTLQYPFDVHGGDFDIKAKAPGSTTPIVALSFDASVHGFSIYGDGLPNDEHTALDANFYIARSMEVIMGATLSMVSLTLVVLSAVNVAFQVIVRGRKAEFVMMSWIAALLFVIPGARNALPAAPPPGGLIDVGLFFWLYILGVGSLLVLIGKWTFQKP